MRARATSRASSLEVFRDLAGDRVRTALGFESADIAIQFAGAIEVLVPSVCDAAPGGRIGSSELNRSSLPAGQV